jgi:hypothetical protein
MREDWAALAGRIRQSLIDLEHVAARAEQLMARYHQSGDDGYLDGVALNLHGFYGGIERIFEDVARTVDHSIPAGPDWHHSLVLQMSAEVASIRPPAITGETRYCLEDYRGFRHVVRNVYTFNLRPGRLQELTSTLRACYLSVLKDLTAFAGFLERLSQEHEDT